MINVTSAVAGVLLATASAVSAQDNPFVNTDPQGGVYLRGSFASPSLLSSPPRSAEQRSKDQFLLNFNADNLTGVDTFRAKGALFWSSRKNHVDRRYLQISSMNAGVFLDQSRVDGVKSQDLIEFRFGGAWMWSTSNPDVNWKNHFLSADLGWVTSSKGDLSVYTADLTYLPLGNTPGFGGSDLFMGNARVSFEPTLNAHLQRVEEDGGRPEFAGAQSAGFVGAGLRADITFADGPWQQLILSAGIEGMHSLSSDRDSTDLFHASATWLLTPDSNVGLTLTYDRGSTPTTAEVDRLSVNIGFSF